MTITPTALLSLPIITTGTESGTWGDVVDNGLTSYLDIAIAGGLAISITTTDVTLTKTAGTNSATNIGATTAQYAILNVSGAMTAARSLILPSVSKIYVINNSCTGAFTLTVKGAATTGITMRNGESALVAWNGTDFVKVSSGTTGLTNNTAIGYQALNSRTTATQNTAFGELALQSTRSGGLNTAVGYAALRDCTGSQNTAVGQAALRSATTTTLSVAVGDSALQNLITGNNHTAVGQYSSGNITGGSANTAVGMLSLGLTTTSCSQAVGIGYAAIAQNTADGTVGIGANALYANTSGANNTAVGYAALTTNTIGANCTAVGYNALTLNGASSNNTAVGYNTLGANTSGASNSVLGTDAGGAITTGSGNVVVGGHTAAGVSAPAFNITTEDNRVSVGSTSTTNAYVQVAWTVVSDARDKTDFADVPHGLDFVSKLQPTAYRYKETRDATEGHGPVRYGFKAQDVLALEGDTPVIIDAGTPDKLYFNDQALIAVLVNAIKELKAEFDAYKAAHA
jgi:hypothetical protein